MLLGSEPPERREVLAVGREQVGLVAVRDIAAKPIQPTWVIGLWAGGVPEGPVNLARSQQQPAGGIN